MRLSARFYVLHERRRDAQRSRIKFVSINHGYNYVFICICPHFIADGTYCELKMNELANHLTQFHEQKTRSIIYPSSMRMTQNQFAFLQ